MDSHLKDLNKRMTNIVLEFCNKLGCGNCGLEWPGGCSAIELQGKIMDYEKSLAKEAFEK